MKQIQQRVQIAPTHLCYRNLGDRNGPLIAPALPSTTPVLRSRLHEVLQPDMPSATPAIQVVGATATAPVGAEPASQTPLVLKMTVCKLALEVAVLTSVSPQSPRSRTGTTEAVLERVSGCRSTSSTTRATTPLAPQAAQFARPASSTTIQQGSTAV